MDSPDIKTATQMMESQRKRGIEAAMARLLDDLREFMRAYPRDAAGELPEHDVVWVTALSENWAGKTIIDAINGNPELWSDAIPEDVVIVPRQLLKRATDLDDLIIDSLNDHGLHLVWSKAAALRYAREEAERLARYPR